jgi:hypothetical protein
MVITVAKAGETIINNNETFFIVFVGVIYFEGPMSWNGANFSLGSKEECINILQPMGQDYLKGFRNRVPNLYKLKQGGFEVKIVAETVEKSETPPDV